MSQRFKLFMKADMDLAAVLLITAVSEDLSGTGSRQKLKSPAINIFPDLSDT